MAAKIYRVRIAKDGQEFEAEGDKAFVLDMLKRFESPVAVADASSSKATKTSRKSESGLQKLASGKTVSVGEFIRQIGFKRHTDIVLAFGYYLEQQGARDFTPADVNNCYYEAKMENSNTSQMFILNIRRGFMMEAKGTKGGKRRYTLTQSGVNFVTAKAAKPVAA
jgi:hypothetical protein